MCIVDTDLFISYQNLYPIDFFFKSAFIFIDIMMAFQAPNWDEEMRQIKENLSNS